MLGSWGVEVEHPQGAGETGVGAAVANPYQVLHRGMGRGVSQVVSAALGSVRVWGGLSRTYHAGLGLPEDQVVPAYCRFPVGRCHLAGLQLHAAAGE